MIKGNQNNSSSGWAESEFGIVNFGDKRLSKRLLKIADSFANAPERAINQACEDWHQSKAAYRFFQNEAVSERKILDSHIIKTIEGASEHSTILAIQDTCYISYKNHKKTQGLGVIAARVRSKTTNFQTHGLVMHTTFAVTTEGLPIGLLDQKISSRPLLYMEPSPPVGEEPMSWMLITNMNMSHFEEAIEKIQWYCLRWRIEIFHKILKSGFKVEECRLGTADRLIRFLTIMSVIAWRIFFITLVSRANPNLPCTSLLADEEWKVLYAKINHTKHYPETPPTIRDAVRWVAQLGGFLARKNDGEPGPITLWIGRFPIYSQPF